MIFFPDIPIEQILVLARLGRDLNGCVQVQSIRLFDFIYFMTYINKKFNKVLKR